MQETRHLLSLFIVTLCLSALAFAQASDTGLPPFGSFQGSNLDVVAFNSGNLHVEIPLWSLPQRAAPNTGLRLVYDIPTWQVNKSNPTPTTTQWTVGPVSGEKVYWNLFHDPVGAAGTNHDTIETSCIWTNPVTGLPTPVQYFVHTNYIMTDTHGTKHFFNLRHLTMQNPPCDVPPPADVDSGFALDGSGYKADISSDRNHPTIQLPHDIGQFNGNLGNELSTGGTTTFQTDQNGVLIARIDTVLDSDGQQQQFRIDYAAVPNFTTFCPLLPLQPLPSGTTCVEGGFPLNLPQKLTLPNNKFYLFTWSTDGNADLLRIDLPTGGYFAYSYRSQVSLVPFQHGITQYKARRVVASRTVSDGNLPPQTWTYSIFPPTGGTVRDPLGNEEVHSFGPPAGGADDQVNYEVQVDYYQGTAASGKLLRTIKKDYLAETDLGLGPEGVAHGTINARLVRTTTILGDAAQTQTKTETDYEMFTDTSGGPVTFLNPIEQREYDYSAGAPGPLLRRTVYTYLHTGNPNYIARNIVHRVLGTTVYDGVGNQVAQTVNEYDNYSHPGQPMLASNAVQHDPAYDTSFIYRGNLTAVSHWRNTDGAMLTTTNQYDDAGNLLSTIDPLGHKTSFDYTDSWANTACVPAGQAKVFATTITNALTQPTTKKYNSCTGTLASVTDPNLRPTSYSYDLMNRVASVTYPDGGNITNTYDDTHLLITTGSLIALPGSRIYSRKHYDQLGRVVQTELCEDGTPDCATSVKTDTAYDEIGQIKTVSNPYRTANDPGPTNGITRTEYDGLGRITKITKQDGSFSTISYDANCNTAADEAGKQRKSCTDSLGRLTQVFEDPLVANYETDYSYDTLGNLTSVIQKGGATDPTQWRNRSFVYNCLSQLLSASNPESGKISYSYDDAGNLHTRTSPAPNQTITVGTQATGSVTIGGRQNCRQGCDYGTVSITVNGFTASTNYADTSTSTTIASSLASSLNASAYVTAASSANVVYLTSRATGSAANYSLSATSHSSVLADPFFIATASGSTLAGGTDPPTVTLSYCYDVLNRMTGKAYSAQTCQNGQLPAGTAVASYFYDQTSFNGLTITNNIGRRTGMTDQAGAEAWSYDEAGRIVADRRTTAGITNNTLYSYNKSGGISSMHYPSGSTISYGYNAAGQPINAIDALNVSYAASALYTPAGALASVTSVGDFTSVFTYNTRLQPCRTLVITGTANPGNCSDTQIGNIMDLSYSFSLGAGDNGNVTQITNNRDNTRTQSFTYDSLNRIASAQTASTSGSYCFGEGFSIDPWGNLTTISGLTGYVGCTQENLSATASVQNQINTNNWDAAGNALLTGYSYDAENRLITAGGVTYTYDGDGKRVQKSGGKIYWYGMGTDALDETDLAGSFTNASFNEYVIFGGKRIARRDSSQNIFNYFADHLGTSRVIVQVGQTTPCYDADFYPYGGERMPVVNNCPQNYKFTGKERDTESGLDNFDFRYYASSLGRFMRPDEAFGGWDQNDPQTFNLYSYVRNSPTFAVDPDGHDCVYVGPQISVVRGDCLSDKDNGIYVDGTIDLNSFTYNPKNNTIGFSYTPYDAAPGTFGKGLIQQSMPQMDNGAVNPEGESILAGWALGEVFGKVAGAAWGAIFGRTAAEEGGYVIGKLDDIRAPGALKPGERALPIPKGAADAYAENWATNSSALRKIMAEGKPIRDVSVDSAGNPVRNTGFLRAERNLLQNHGWKLKGGYWLPPHN